jgi:hypothetical protein
MKTLDEVVEYTRGLPEDLQERVRDYAKSLKGKQTKRPVGKMRLDWRGALSDLRDEFTSVELQHAILEWRKKHACS